MLRNRNHWFYVLLGMVVNSNLLAVTTFMTHDQARLRKQQVENPNYELQMELPEDDQPFLGQVKISFVFHPQNQPLLINFDRGKVEKLVINGQTVAVDYNDMAISIPEKILQADKSNQIEIAYSRAYTKDGQGLYWARDPIDNRAYTYSKFEPFFANRMFPCFDQPDLKATYKLTVKAPASWTVVTAVPEKSIRDEGPQRIWEFPATPKFSTYLVSLIAGPYRVWEDKIFRIPLRLLARQSLAEHVPVEEWFRTTRRGFDFFERFLGVPYAFGKYDQILVPDFVSGAMENVAAVTFNERSLVRGRRTLANDQFLADVVLHEMAHMWFGNLVTMTWWDDLWLNESFATYAAYQATAADPRFPGTWLDFFHYKEGASWADQLVTTHPIVADIPDTNAGSANFDQITYNKGAAFLKQLHFTVGDAAFQAGLKKYFVRHAYGNTQVQDFIRAMEEAMNRDLKKFSADWLTTAGINTVKTEARCEKDIIQELALIQGAALPDFASLREHSTRISLYRFHKGEFQLIKSDRVTYQGERTLWSAAKGLACPDLIFINDDDHDYVKPSLDARSLQSSVQNLRKIKNPLQRAMIWTAVANSVSEGEAPIGDFLVLMNKYFVSEEDPMLLEVINNLLDDNVLDYLPGMPPSAERTRLLADLKHLYEKKLGLSSTTDDMKQMLWINYLTLLVLDGDSAGVLRLWENKMPALKNTLKQDERWRILQGLSQLGHKSAISWAQAELKKDSSTRGKYGALRVEAIFPDYDQKMKLLDKVLQTANLSSAERGATLDSLFPPMQAAFRMRYAPEFMKAVDKIVREGDPTVGRQFVFNLLPKNCGAESAPLLDELIQRNYRSELHKRIRITRQTDERCRKVIEGQARFSRK